MAFDVPILFLVFSRPETTQEVFKRIKEIQPTRLFVAADGARPGKEGEQEKCEAVRKIILDGIDWNCEVKTLFRDSNLGCGPAVSGAISWFFDNVEEGIILEDDTLPDTSFFHFCRALLEKYRSNEHVKMISGDNFQDGRHRGNGSYYFSAYSHIWGWASWRRTWKQYDFRLQSISEKDIEEYHKDKPGSEAVIGFWKKVLEQCKTGLINTWDYQLLFSIWKNKGISILPNVNLVSNIGFGEASTHTKNKDDKSANVPTNSITEIVHPSAIEIDKAADHYYFKNYLGGRKTLLQRIKRKITGAY